MKGEKKGGSNFSRKRGGGEKIEKKREIGKSGEGGEKKIKDRNRKEGREGKRGVGREEKKKKG